MKPDRISINILFDDYYASFLNEDFDIFYIYPGKKKEKSIKAT